MANPKKNPLKTMATIAGSVLTIGAAVTYAVTVIDKRIDDRVQNNADIKYLTILVREIATSDQKDRADKEFIRWNKQQLK